MFNLKAPYSPAGDQPKAIKQILENFQNGNQKLVLLGATGTGKTFTMANIVEKLNLPTLVLSHNKTLAAQLTTEFKGFFPDNAINYFVSYFDYYQPESYLPEKDMYIEKDSAINQEIEMYRLAAMSNLLARKDVIIVSSVSAIYGLGTAELFYRSSINFEVGNSYDFKKLKKQLLNIQYKPVKGDITPGTFNFLGNMLDIYSSIENIIYRIHFDEEKIMFIEKKNPQTFEQIGQTKKITIWPATQFIQNMDNINKILKKIEKEKNKQVEYFKKNNQLLFAQRIEQRINYDIKMIKETGFANGIENYSRYFEQRKENEPPQSLFDYFPDEFLLIIDESHMTIPQFQAMPLADKSRKLNLINYGFRLPSAIDHRPLFWHELEYMLGIKDKKKLENELNKIPQTDGFNPFIGIEYLEKTGRKKKKVYILFVSATPAEYEKKVSGGNIIEQIIRPTGLLDPITYIYPKSGDYSLLEKSLEKIEQN